MRVLQRRTRCRRGRLPAREPGFDRSRVGEAPASAAAAAAGAPSSRPMPVSARKDQRDGESSSAAASATARAANPEISNSLARRISTRGDRPLPNYELIYQSPVDPQPPRKRYVAFLARRLAFLVSYMPLGRRVELERRIVSRTAAHNHVRRRAGLRHDAALTTGSTAADPGAN